MTSAVSGSSLFSTDLLVAYSFLCFIAAFRVIVLFYVLHFCGTHTYDFTYTVKATVTNVFSKAFDIAIGNLLQNSMGGEEI